MVAPSNSYITSKLFTFPEFLGQGNEVGEYENWIAANDSPFYQLN